MRRSNWRNFVEIKYRRNPLYRTSSASFTVSSRFNGVFLSSSAFTTILLITCYLYFPLYHDYFLASSIYFFSCFPCGTPHLDQPKICKFAMSKDTSNMLFETCWTPCKNRMSLRGLDHDTLYFEWPLIINNDTIFDKRWMCPAVLAL